jgi:hypothetical protein
LGDREFFGCGWDDRYAGKATAVTKIMGREVKTCPQFYARQPAYIEMREQLEDYRRGSLGNVDHIALPRLEALGVLDSAEADWHSKQEENLVSKAKKKG